MGLIKSNITVNFTVDRKYSQHNITSDLWVRQTVPSIAHEKSLYMYSYSDISIRHQIPWADPGGAQGVRPPSGRKCPFCRRVQFSMFFPLLLETPKNVPRPVSDKYSESSLVGSGWSNKALVHCTKPTFSLEKALVRCTKLNNFPQKKKCFFCN
jgi:hypothetical protein